MDLLGWQAKRSQHVTVVSFGARRACGFVYPAFSEKMHQRLAFVPANRQVADIGHGVCRCVEHDTVHCGESVLQSLAQRGEMRHLHRRSGEGFNRFPEGGDGGNGFRAGAQGAFLSAAVGAGDKTDAASDI